MPVYKPEPEVLLALSSLMSRKDPLALRMQKLVAMPDLSRQPDSPVQFVTEAIKKVPTFAGCDLVEIPEIVSIEENFDLLGAPKDHPSRRSSDTYYLDKKYILRTQTTTMWPYYLRDYKVLSRLESKCALVALCHGKVYRNDEVDRYHHPCWHNLDGLGICKSDIRQYTIGDLEEMLVTIAKSIFGETVKYRTETDTFPFTDPSIQLFIEWNGEWVEVLGAGLVNPKVLTLLSLNPLLYNGWAFGFGLDRLAMIKMGIPDIRILWSTDERITKQFTGLDSKFREVSKYPYTDRDVSVILSNDVELNDIYAIIRDCGEAGGELVIEEVNKVDQYENPKVFGPNRKSFTFRIRYRSHTRTLTHNEINRVQEDVRNRLVSELSGVLR